MTRRACALLLTTWLVSVATVFGQAGELAEAESKFDLDIGLRTTARPLFDVWPESPETQVLHWPTFSMASWGLSRTPTAQTTAAWMDSLLSRYDAAATYAHTRLSLG